MSDRKYRQKGYQDDDRGAPRGRSSPPPPRREGPRGRGLGAPTETVFRCARCGTSLPVAGEVATDAVCPKCGADLHTCTNCRHFDTGTPPNECRQPVTERIAAKAKANTCELFAVKTAKEFGNSPGRPPDDPRAAFDALFKI